MERLKELRERAGISQMELSRRSGVDAATINQAERNRRSPTIDTLERLASALGIELADFFPRRSRQTIKT